MLAATGLAAGTVRATQVRPVNLEEMTLRADRIFSARCVSVEIVHDAIVSGDVTLVTFQVERAVKGQVGDRVTVKMIAGDDGRGGGTAGIPAFRPGEEVVLFLYGESEMGLSSPVGLGQGQFRVATDKEGRRIAVNDFANRRLLRGLTTAAAERLGAAFTATGEGTQLDPGTLLDMAQALTALGR